MDKITDRMLLLEETVQRNDQSFEDVVVLNINHCMENSFVFSRVLCRAFGKVVFIGAPYNDNMVPVGEGFIGYSAIRRKKSDDYTLYREGVKTGVFSGSFIDVVQEMVANALDTDLREIFTGDKRLLVIEDGGYHYSALRNLEGRFPGLRDRVLGAVEQTTSGTVRGKRVAEASDFWYTHLSVARSDAKMNIEARFIAERVIEELSGFLYGVNTFLDYHTVLLIGYGVIGRSIGQLLVNRPLDLVVNDIDDEIMRIAEEDGFRTVREIDAGTFESDTVIFGNTGCASFTIEMLEAFFAGKAGKLYLCSSSSQEEEFWSFLTIMRGERALPEGVIQEEVREFNGVDEFVFSTAEGKRKSVFLIARGRPVNFFRPDVISLTNCMIDLIFSEMLKLSFWICRHRDAQKRIYLLGRDRELCDDWNEEELFGRWLALYGLSKLADKRVLEAAHPAYEKLRVKLN